MSHSTVHVCDFFKQILCNGPGTCVPPCLISFILKVYNGSFFIVSIHFNIAFLNFLGSLVEVNVDCICRIDLSRSHPVTYWQNHVYIGR